ncbi:hypothetical protein SARC_12128 [Sphaeroforma arctica JP610]|uniref:Uncharacterized protein n=1 Tax=Sphaeroforma arctica JP610 TaxID=667725 RepID=A0A0L0FH14_9EUKA|nr:hypothetical protein SARC_12128 [Sphaeroforma arctica JP610]KNC75343.1 hypothetical protein SARC_12128 [Sphaeroforma arctica JP610]|eukprot:XP_014149245.1 hypothetical protein SARC_12128 [Sphaeroforma arctica JP610]
MDEPRVFSPSSVDDGSNVVGSGKFSGDLPPLSSFGMHDPGTVRGSSHSDVATRNDTVNDVSDGKPPEMRRNSSKFDNTKNTTVSRTELCNGILVRLKSASTADADELSESRHEASTRTHQGDTVYWHDHTRAIYSRLVLKFDCVELFGGNPNKYRRLTRPEGHNDEFCNFGDRCTGGEAATVVFIVRSSNEPLINDQHSIVSSCDAMDINRRSSLVYSWVAKYA